MMLPYALEELRKDGFEVSCIIDDTKSLQGTIYEGLDIISRNEAEKRGVKNIMITSTHIPEIMNHYINKNMNIISFGAYNVCKHYDEYIDVRDNYLNDEKSKQVFNVAMYAQLTSYFKCDNLHSLIAEENQYFAIPEFRFFRDEHIADCGAFTGDTLEQYLNHCLTPFVRYYAFEPGRKQYKALCKRAERIKAEWCLEDEAIITENVGTGAFETYAGGSELDGTTAFSLSGADIDSDEKIRVTSLDSYFNDKKVTFIKADIQSMEHDLLLGAKKIIFEQKPKIAICTYHLPCDLYRLAIEIKKINPEYKFAMRHHSNEYDETVLYCW